MISMQFAWETHLLYCGREMLDTTLLQFGVIFNPILNEPPVTAKKLYESLAKIGNNKGADLAGIRKWIEQCNGEVNLQLRHFFTGYRG